MGVMQDLLAAFELTWDSAEGPLGSILPLAALPVERRKANSETLDLWFSDPLATTVGRLLRLSPVLSFRPTELDGAAAALVQQRWEALDESLRQVLGKDYLRKSVEEAIGKVRQFIAALRDFGTGRSGQHTQEVHARSLEAWGAQIRGGDDCSPGAVSDDSPVAHGAADEEREVSPPTEILAGNSAEVSAVVAPGVAGSSSDEDTPAPALQRGRGSQPAGCNNDSSDDDIATLLVVARARLQATSLPALVTPPTRPPRSPPASETAKQALPTRARTAPATSAKKKHPTGSLPPAKKHTPAQTALEDDPGSYVDPEEWSCEGQFYPWFWDAGRWVWVGAPEDGPTEAALPEAVPEALPAALPVALPEALPEALPKALPRSLPEDLPEDLPEALTKKPRTVQQEDRGFKCVFGFLSFCFASSFPEFGHKSRCAGPRVVQFGRRRTTKNLGGTSDMAW